MILYIYKLVIFTKKVNRITYQLINIKYFKSKKNTKIKKSKDGATYMKKIMTVAMATAMLGQAGITSVSALEQGQGQGVGTDSAYAVSLDLTRINQGLLQVTTAVDSTAYLLKDGANHTSLSSIKSEAIDSCEVTAKKKTTLTTFGLDKSDLGERVILVIVDENDRITSTSWVDLKEFTGVQLSSGSALSEQPEYKLNKATVNTDGEISSELISTDLTSSASITSGSTVENKNTFVPVYTDENGKDKVVSFSRVEDNTLKFLSIDDLTDLKFVDNSKTFGDIGTSWAKNYIDFASSRDILVGTGNETFAPEAEVSRAMLVTVLGRFADVDMSNLKNPFSDVAEGQWYTEYVEWANAKGITSGIEDLQDKTFAPGQAITREEMAVMIVNYYEYLGMNIVADETTSFGDDELISEWASESVYKLQALGVLDGDDEGNFNPQSTLTRAELAKISEKLVETELQLVETATSVTTELN